GADLHHAGADEQSDHGQLDGHHDGVEARAELHLVRSTPMARRLLARRSVAPDLYPARIAGYRLPERIRSAAMADNRKPAKTKPRQPDKGKLARGAAARRLEEKRRRQRTLLWTGVAVVSLVALIAVIVFAGREAPQAQNTPVSEAARAAGRAGAGSQ